MAYLKRGALCPVPQGAVCASVSVRRGKTLEMNMEKINPVSVTPSHAFHQNMGLRGIDPPQQKAQKFKQPD